MCHQGNSSVLNFQQDNSHLCMGWASWFQGLSGVSPAVWTYLHCLRNSIPLDILSIRQSLFLSHRIQVRKLSYMLIALGNNIQLRTCLLSCRLGEA